MIAIIENKNSKKIKVINYIKVINGKIIINNNEIISGRITILK